MKARAKPGPRVVFLLVRPALDVDHPWWPRRPLEGSLPTEYAYAAIDPYDPPGWSAVIDGENDFSIDAIELWRQTKLTIDEHVSRMKETWLDEYGPDDDDGSGYRWDFLIQDSSPS
jgi:hypothetical protein